MDILINAVRHENVTVTISPEELVKSLKNLLYTSQYHFIKNTPETDESENRFSLFQKVNPTGEIEIRELTKFEIDYFNACMTIEIYLRNHVKP